MARRAKRIEVPLDLLLSEVAEPENCAKLTNGYLRGGAIVGRPGWGQIGSGVRGVPVKLLTYFDDSSIYHLLVFTTREAYQLSDGDWSLVTPVETTGSVSCSGTTVTGVGTSWLSSLSNCGRIKFGTTDPNASGSWYEIASVDSDTQLTLATAGPTVSGVSYVATRSFQIDYDDYKDALDACIIELPGSTRVICCTNKDGMFEWDGSGQFTEMPGAKAIGLKPRILKTYMNHLIALAPDEGSTTYWQRYRWTAPGTYDDWTSSGSGYEDLIGRAETSRIVGADRTANLIVYESQDTYVVSYVGGTTVFTGSPVSRSVGGIAKEGRVQLPDSTLVLTRDGPYMAAGGEKVGDLQKWLYTGEYSYEPDDGYTACGDYWSRERLGLLTVPSDDNLILVVGESGEPVAWWDFGEQVTAVLDGYAYESPVSWDKAVGTWDGYSGAWNSQATTLPWTVFIVATYSGGVYYIDSSYPSSANLTWETVPYIPEVASRVNEVRLQAKGSGSISMEYSTDYGDTWTSLGSHTLTSTVQELSWFPNKWCDSMKFRVTAPVQGLEISKPVIYTIERRQR